MSKGWWSRPPNRSVRCCAPRTPTNLRGDARLVQLLRNAVDAAGDDDGWANLRQVGGQIGNQASFDPRNYGYRKLSDLIEATGLFDVKRQNQVVLIRDRRRT